jgi:hypothetical protein
VKELTDEGAGVAAQRKRRHPTILELSSRMFSSHGIDDDSPVTCAFLNMTSCCSKLVGGPFLYFAYSGRYCKKYIIDKLHHIIIIVTIDKN